LKVNYAACAICDSSWGNLWEEVDGTRLFFCCDVCANQFRNLVSRIKSEAGWDSIDALNIAGDRRGRTCHAVRAERSFECEVAFNAQGEIRRFVAAPLPSHG
jgi:Ta0938